MSTSMQNPTVIKLRNAGEMVILKVASCAPMKIGQYPEVSIIGQAVIRDEITNQWFEIRVPDKSATRQFERMKLEYSEAVGCILKISRDPNQSDPLKAYWGITLVQGTDVPTPTIPVVPRASQTARINPQPMPDEYPHGVGKQVPPPWEGPPPDDAPVELTSGNAKMDQVFKVYDLCLAHAWLKAGQYRQDDQAVEPSVVASMAATLFIESSKRGVVL